MKARFITCLLVIVVGGLWGCASSKAIEPKSSDARPAVNQAPDQPPIADAKPESNPVQASTPAPKLEKAQADTSKVTTNSETVKVKSNNDVSVKAETTAHKETMVAAKEQTKESKPPEMKAANALDRNPYLSSSVKPLLPARTNVTDAATGFKKEKEFVAALHLSRNLGIPFDQIKTRMTGEHRMSLTDALRDIRSDMEKKEAKAEVKKAEEQAKDDEKHAKEEAKVLSASSRK